MAGSYSFLDVQCVITGPGGSFNIAEGGVAEEGITVAMRDPKNTMVTGADGTPMHSLHASKGGTFTIRLQKTSPMNALLDEMYRRQTGSSAFHGRNNISVSNAVAADAIVGQKVAFSRLPDYNAGTEAGTNDWVFDVGVVDMKLGAGLSY